MPARCISEFVVDAPQRAVRQKVDTIRLSSQAYSSRSPVRLQLELTIEGIFEKPLGDGHGPLGLHLEDRFRETRIDSRAQQSRPLHHPLALRQRCEERLHDFAEYPPGIRQVFGRDAPASASGPLLEERLKDGVNENAEILRAQRGFVLRILLESQDTLAEIDERAPQIPLERADCV